MTGSNGNDNGERRRRRGSDGKYVTKLTDEVVEKIVLGLRAGVSLETAAQFAEVDEATVHRWMQRARDGQATPDECQFAAAVQHEIAAFQVTQAAMITRPETPAHVRLDYLGRRWPRLYGPTNRVRFDQTIAGTVEHEHSGEIRLISGDLSAYSDEELEQLKRLLEKGLAAQQKRAGELLQLPPGKRTPSSPG